MFMSSINKILILALLALGCGGKSDTAPPLAAKDGEDGLKELITAAKTACDTKNFATAKQIIQSLIPTKDTLAKAFKDDAPAAFTSKVLEQFSNFPQDDEKLGCLLTGRPNQTDIQVHRATTEEIAVYKKGTGAYEFPGGARRLAEQVMRPGAAFYEVEFLQPGEGSGIKFHLFFWDGTQWRMLAQAWRALPKT
jgi:hypothetical protein